MKNFLFIVLIYMHLSWNYAFAQEQIIPKYTIESRSAITIGIHIGLKENHGNSKQVQAISTLQTVSEILQTDVKKYLNQSIDRSRDLDILINILEGGLFDLKIQNKKLQNEKNYLFTRQKQIIGEQKKALALFNASFKKLLPHQNEADFFALQKIQVDYQNINLDILWNKKTLAYNKAFMERIIQGVQKLQKNHEAYVKGVFAQ
jgi:hypothetical protein